MNVVVKCSPTNITVTATLNTPDALIKAIVSSRVLSVIDPLTNGIGFVSTFSMFTKSTVPISAQSVENASLSHPASINTCGFTAEKDPTSVHIVSKRLPLPPFSGHTFVNTAEKSRSSASTANVHLRHMQHMTAMCAAPTRRKSLVFVNIAARPLRNLTNLSFISTCTQEPSPTPVRSVAEHFQVLHHVTDTVLILTASQERIEHQKSCGRTS